MTTMAQLAPFGVPADLGADQEVPFRIEITVFEVEQLKALLDLGLNVDARERHLAALNHDIMTPADPDMALISRVEAHVFGNAELSDEDRAAAEEILPISVFVTGAPGPITISAPYDLSTRDGSISVVTFTDVTIAQGGYFACEATPLIFDCDTLTRTGTSGGNFADFNILGRTGASQDTPGPPGFAGQAGSGAPGQCSSKGIAGKGGGDGTVGAQGTKGADGRTGNSGQPSRQATITIKKTLTVERQLSIYTHSGPGGRGGNGAQGGPGQQGGNGGSGVTCGCTGNGGGSGQSGGKGGPGGRAGDGGEGVDADKHIAVFVPQPADVPKVSWTQGPALPGKAGDPGGGGAGGQPGKGGSGGKDNRGGSDGGSGGPGDQGAFGQPGKHEGKPAEVSVQPR
jgi:hypothetical protein